MILSIITINKNNALGLRKTIESVLSQTSSDIEYIIIDGGSNDGSVEVIQSFTDIIPGIYCPLHSPQYQPESVDILPLAPNPICINYWISEPDSGIYHAMNKGILISKGDYCQFLNSGDCLVKNDVIEKMLASLPNCSIYYGNMLKQMPKGRIIRDTCEKGNFTMLSFYKGALNHSPALIKHNLFNKYGLYDETLKIVSDWKWYIIAIVLHNETVKYVNLDVTCFNMKGISNTEYMLDKFERRKVLEELLPAKILSDYDTHWQNIDLVCRINSYKILKWVFFFIERVLFKWEKLIRKKTI